MIGLGILVIFANLFCKNTAVFAEEWSYLDIDAQTTSKVIGEIAPYTYFEEDLGDIESTLLASQNSEFLAKSDELTTEKSKLEVEYIVQKGDTMSTIGKKFDMHVASILDRNGMNFDQVEKISPGQALIIPAKDTSSSQEWLAKLNEKKEAEKQAQQKLLAQQAAKKKTTLALQKRSTVYRDRSGYDGGSDGSWAMPTGYKYISRGVQRGHTGIDMVEGVGTPVYASKSGKVIETTGNWGGGYGNSIELDHGSGQTSRYAHLSEFAVGVGDYVSQGQLIGYSGNTGWSTGPHLHFEARQNGSPFNPF
ncbi:MAG: M23 family metallopeptidase [Patescibacteria group bacterium]|nr:M23 family metallopeptidase [Patescibacteria group bacterium]